MTQYSLLSLFLVILAAILSDIICTDQTNKRQNNAWSQLGNNQNGPSPSLQWGSNSSTPWPELGQRPNARRPVNNQNRNKPNGQDAFIRNEQNYEQPPVRPNNQQSRVNNQQNANDRHTLMRQDTFVVSPKPNTLTRQDTFIVPPKNQMNNLNRQDTFVVQQPITPPTNKKPLNRQDTFLVNPNPQNKNAWNGGNPFGNQNKPPPSQGNSAPKQTPSAGSIIGDAGGANNNYSPPDGQVSEDDELREFSENLLKRDTNNPAKYVTVNYQKMTTSRSHVDEAPQALMTVDRAAYSIPSIEKLMLLYNNYIVETNVNEVYTAQEKIEENNLLDVVLQTPVMQYTRNFLIKKGKLGKDPKEFKNLLRQIWFNMYSRGGGKIGSSGFEHVFLAELKRSDVSGLHNWVYFNAEESKNQANYLGYLKKIDLGGKGAILKLHFTFHDVDKPVGSMFLGTSPELEMALYSTCFILRADRICPLKMNNNRFIIRTYTFRYRGKDMIGSAFPEI